MSKAIVLEIWNRLRAFAPIPFDHLELIYSAHAKLVALRKGDQIVSEKLQGAMLGYVHTGLCSIFTKRLATDFNIRNFVGPGDVADLEPLGLSQRHVGLHAIVDSKIVLFEKEILEVLCLRHKEWETIVRRYNQQSLKSFSERVAMLSSDSATERIKFFFSNHPELVQIVPDKFIANHLNIAPETLSRIRKKSRSADAF